jgi:hypothetical protein
MDEACLAARLYNDPSEPRSFESFVVHMHLAWLYLLHAVLMRDGVDTRYRDASKPRRLLKVDGEAKTWELAKCVKYHWPADADPVRANIEFFIALRNKIEHRYARFQTALMLAVGGHSQALMLNFDEELRKQFGERYSLATRLRFPVFVGTFTPEGEDTLRVLHSKLPAPLRKFLATYQACLDTATRDDRRFELRLRVALELAQRGADVPSIQFTRLDDMTEQERAVVEEMGRKGQVVVREQKRSVRNLDWLKASEAAKQIGAGIPYRFNQSHFTRAWRSLEFRPPTGDPKPERTDERYCIYDEPHHDYLYSPAYVKRLTRELGKEDGYRATLGVEPVAKGSAATRASTTKG